MTISDAIQQVAEAESWSTLLGMVTSLRNGRVKSNKSDSHPAVPCPAHPHLSSHEPGQQRDNSGYDSSDHIDARPSKRVRLDVDAPHLSAHDGRQRVSVGATRDTTPRPPTKLTIAEPHGDIFQTTNGVRTKLSVGQDGLQDDASSPGMPIGAGAATQTASAKKEDKRTLRSQHEGSRLKSELSVYFPSYEDIINDVPQEPELLTADTIIHIIDQPDAPPVPITPSPSKGGKLSRNGPAHQRRPSSINAANSPFKSLSTPNKFNGAQIVDFSTIEKSVPHHPQDPLTDAFYFKPHRRAERKEKQLRNIEKERAMHEKVQLERLLEGLQGHDWLRVMGISGVTDSESKKYESKRDFFISEVTLLVTKFKTWKEEEKRIKVEKEAAALALERGEDEEDDAEAGAEQAEDEPDSSEMDASAARQLQMEASGSTPVKVRQRAPMPPPPLPLIYREPSPERPFTSFYSKPHMRAAALGTQRHGRTVSAFGLPVPEMEEHDFTLPADYVTKDALKESARRRRRMKRESIADASAA